MAHAEPGPGAESPGLLASLRNLAVNAVGILRTRLELLGTEIAEERLYLARIAFWAVLAVIFLSVSLVMFTLLVVVVFWNDPQRVVVFALLAAGYLAVGLGIGFWVRASLRARPKMFSSSLAELAKDREKLTTHHVS